MVKALQVVTAAVAIGLSGAAIYQSANSASTGEARANLTIIAPAAVGGGWDGFSREAQQVLRADSIVNNAKVVNIPGAGGTIGLSQFVQMQGEESTIMTTGGVMIGAIELKGSGATLKDVVPLARLSDDYSALVVPADSEYETLDDVVTAWKADPKGFSISGGSLGSIDHLLTGAIAGEIGINPKDANYIAYSGGGEALNSLLSHTTDIGISGYNEIADQVEAGTLRALAISSGERIETAPDLPTFKEQGINVEMSNWRGFLAPPGIPEEAEEELREIVDELHRSEAWQEAVHRNSWTDAYMTGEELDRYIDEETARTKVLIEQLGL
ncbi:Bug family tripartite tricarboxylate transporter substrate binding protein [Corynebacterium coyleae]|uniref:Tripartite tricarboxylate transporter substrate binding protein n=1 Tax=Corynebacterium coyleae TaxID=53374 RepID=A0AAP7CCV8_9CORY|nr:tripartite tricarboxylate transporter substrate binding protein [Corynebacterium coyleae]NJJ04550.1 tripartite tricarboxylate transporter substrate binding protein [Corynebacterium coyleae]